jgi:hypothetical protein
LITPHKRGMESPLELEAHDLTGPCPLRCAFVPLFLPFINWNSCREVPTVKRVLKRDPSQKGD